MVDRKALKFAMQISWISDSSVSRATDWQFRDVSLITTRGSRIFHCIIILYFRLIICL